MRYSFAQKLALNILPFILALVLKLLFLTCRKKYHFHDDFFKYQNQSLIFAFWHRNILPQLILTNHLFLKKRQKYTITSSSFDGELMMRTMSYFGLKALRGSSSRGGAKALVGAIKTLKNGKDIAITPDGHNKYKQVALGIVTMSQKTSTPIVPISGYMSAFWKLKSWDRFCIPKPFCTITFYVDSPFGVEGLQEIQARKKIKKQLHVHEF